MDRARCHSALPLSRSASCCVIVLGSTLNNKLVFEKRVPLDRVVTGNGTMSIRGFCHTPQCGRIIRGRADADLLKPSQPTWALRVCENLRHSSGFSQMGGK